MKKLNTTIVNFFFIFVFSLSIFFASDKAFFMPMLVTYALSILLLLFKVHCHFKAKGTKAEVSKNSLVIEIIIIALIMRAIAFCLPASLSDDHYRYLWDGILVNNSDNPYLLTPSQVLNKTDDKLSDNLNLYEKMNSPDYLSCYPPTAQFFFALVAKFHRTDSQSSYYLMKIILGGLELLVLISTLRKISTERNFKKYAYVFCLIYAHNPLLVIETWGQCHLDTLAMALMAFCLFFFKKQKFLLASLFLCLAVWTKIVPIIFLVPIIIRLVYLRKKLAILTILSGLIIFTITIWSPFFFLQALKNIFTSIGLWFNKFDFYGGLYLTTKFILENANIYLCQIGILSWQESYNINPISNTITKAFFLAMLCETITFDIKNKFRYQLSYICALIALIFSLSNSTNHPWYFLLYFYFIAQNPKIFCQSPLLKAGFFLSISAFFTYSIYAPYSIAKDVYYASIIFGWLGALLILIYFRTIGKISKKPKTENIKMD